MKVDRVKATIRFSKESYGTWKSLEIGAEAIVGTGEDWRVCEKNLYAALADDFKELWNGNSHQGHWCAEHGLWFVRHGDFYSHEKPDGKWCNEKAQARS